jgi:uncharacterized protein (TIGR00369 family)
MHECVAIRMRESGVPSGEGSYLAAIRAQGSRANPFFQLMGITVAGAADGKAVLTMTVQPSMHNGVGWLQGGMYTALTDEAMALALYTVIDPTERIATISESTSFLRGVREGSVVAVGRVVKRGRRVAFTEGEVYADREQGEILARSTAAFAVMS